LKTADGGAWSKKHRIQPFRSVGKGRTSKRQRIVRRNPWERIGLQFNQEAKKTKLNLLLQQRQKEAHEIKARNFAEEAAAKEAARN